MIFVSLVPSNEVNKVWPNIRRFVADVVEVADGRATIDAIYDNIINDRTLLWVAFDHDFETKKTKFMGFATTVIKFYPNKRMLVIEYLGGEDMDKWLPQGNEVLSTFGASQECDGLEAIGRKGWEKVLKEAGWSPKFAVMEKIFKRPEAISARVLN